MTAAATIVVDRVRCEGHGLCEDAAPALIAIDDAAEPVLLTGGHVPPGQQDAALAAVDVCPLAALHLRRDGGT